jgi:hypothetical protein
MDNLFFWGILMVFSGAALLARMLVSGFPAVKVIAGGFLILLGVKIITGGFSIWPLSSGKNEIFFSSFELEVPADLFDDYQMAFSRASFDLAEMEMPEGKTGLSINSVFSSGIVYLPSGVPVDIKVDAVFATVKMPRRNSPHFGRGTYKSADFDPGMPHISIDVNVVFGSIIFMQKH